MTWQSTTARLLRSIDHSAVLDLVRRWDLLSRSDIARCLALSLPFVQWAPGLGWRDLPLRAPRNQRFRAPVFVKNDVNLMTLGELGVRRQRGMSG